jgi:hypothetical protein
VTSYLIQTGFLPALVIQPNKEILSHSILSFTEGKVTIKTGPSHLNQTEKLLKK